MRTFLFLALATILHAAPENLLRNGSFHGGLLYWHDLSKENILVNDASVGKQSLKVVGSDFIISAPVECERGKNYTISFDVKEEKEGSISIAFHPPARETAVNAKPMWTAGAGKPAKVTTTWSRVSVTFPADVAPGGIWPLTNYMVQLKPGKDNTILIDGMTVTEGDQPTAAYLPRAEIEVTASCANLPGFAGAAGNAFEKGATAGMVAHVFNPGKGEIFLSVKSLESQRAG